jgi:hypothetical protein
MFCHPERSEGSAVAPAFLVCHSLRESASAVAFTLVFLSVIPLKVIAIKRMSCHPEQSEGSASPGAHLLIWRSLDL